MANIYICNAYNWNLEVDKNNMKMKKKKNIQNESFKLK